VGPRAGLDSVAKRKSPCPYLESKRGRYYDKKKGKGKGNVPVLNYVTPH